MKKNFYLLILFALLLNVNSLAQNYQINIDGLVVPKLIFTEFRVDIAGKMYLELSNVGTEAIDLSKFKVISCQNYTGFGTVSETVFTIRNATILSVNLQGTLGAGESYVITSVYDNLLDNGVIDPNGYPMHNIGMLDVADYLMHQTERSAIMFLNKPQWEAYSFDSISPSLYDVDLFNGYMLQYKFQNGDVADSTLVDLANVYRSDPTFQGKAPKSIAGRADAVSSYIMVRKATIKKGNMDWDNSIGTDADDSEWITIPVFKSKYNVFTTVGTHSDYSLDYNSKSEDIVIDEVNKVLTLPWKTVRGEDIIDYFDVGLGMGWSYNPVGDQTFSTVQSGDKLSFYAAGNELKQVDLTVKVTAPAKNLAVAYSRRHRVESLRDQGAIQVSYPELYQIIQGATPNAVGYINGVEFAIRKDSLLANLIIPDNAQYEFTFVDGQERVDLKQGDKLTIYSEDFSLQKQYIINMEAYKASDNAKLKSILWPGIDLNVYGEIWNDIYLPGFSPNNKIYFVLLSSEEKTIPAFQFISEDANATIHVERAIDPEGTIKQRTTKVTVTSEDGQNTNEYEIIFEKVSVPEQSFKAEPFFSEIGGALQYSSVVEIYNPGTEPIDLRNYMIVRGYGGDNLKSAVEHVWIPQYGHAISLSLPNRYRTHYVPGMKWQGNTITAWGEKPGYLEPEYTTPTTILQPGQVYAVGTLQDGGWPGGRFEDRIMPGMMENLDVCLRGWSKQVAPSLGDSANIPYNLNPNGDILANNQYATCMFMAGEHAPDQNSLFLLRIDNDSIKSGLKSVRDPNDYTIVDRFQKPIGADVFMVGGETVTPLRVMRLPHVFKGVTEAGEGMGDDNGNSPNNSGWDVQKAADFNDPNFPPDVYGFNISGSLTLGFTVGWHIMDRYTGYLSIINSNVYNVTPGAEDNLFIKGDLSGATVSTVIPKIIKSSEAQVLEFYRNTTLLSNSDAILAGDILRVTSADGVNQSEYVFENATLSSDNTLTVKSGSDLTISGLSISGFASSSKLSDVIGNILVPGTAIMNVIDENNNLVSFTISGIDSSIIDVKVSPNIYLEVIAENGDIAVYSFDFGTNNSEAILFSMFFQINQETKFVRGVPDNIAVDAFLSKVFANTGATIKILDKADFVRTTGKLSSDDKIVVTSQDESFSQAYTLNFSAIPTSIEENILEKPELEVTLYPNPVSDVLRFRGIDARSVTVYSISGHMVIRKDLSSNELDVSMLEDGMYLISIADAEKNYKISKFIKK